MPVPRITKEDLKARLDDPSAPRPLVLDVRLKYPYEHSTVTLPGAVRMHPEHIDLAALPADREIVAYDSDPEEITSARIVADLVRRGYRAVALAGGIEGWMTAKFPTDGKDSPQAPPPAPGALKD